MQSPQQRFILLPLVGMVLLGLLAGLYLVAYKRNAKPAVAKHKVAQAGDALKYWTKDRMRNAEAMPLPHISSPLQEKGSPHPPNKDQA